MRFKKKWTLLLLLILLAVCGCGEETTVYELQEPEVQEINSQEKDETTQSREIKSQETKEKAPEVISCRVHICGAVVNPGVYELPEGSRICDVIAAAGGLTEEADERSVNQAERIADASQIVVYTKEEAMAGRSNFSTEAPQSASEKVDLNTADLAGLMRLNGIGEVKAQAILSYRRDNGGFQSVEELQQIDGIKGKTFEKIKDSVTVNLPVR